MSAHRLFARLPVDPDIGGSRAEPVAALLVMLGGVVGSLGRAGMSVVVPHAAGAWPWSTLIVNVTGSSALAFVLAVLAVKLPLARAPRMLLGTGLIGGFTTFSTFAVDVVNLSHAGEHVLAASYVIVTIAGTLAAAAAGLYGALALVGEGRP
jgi:fluoride exporter